MTVQPAFSRRTGLTLLEVLITIFVMAIGLLSVLTLFPLAARKIVRSIDNDRAALMAANADGSETILGFRGYVQNQFNLDAAVPGANKLGPGNVYHFDPIGQIGLANYIQQTLMSSRGLKELNAFVAPRVIGRDQLVEWFVSQDEIQFQSWGVPEIGFRKGNRYSVSYLYRRNALGDSNSLDTVMLIYTGRPIEFGNSTEKLLNLLPGAYLPGASELVIAPPGPGPGGPDRTFGRGSWIMDRSPNSVDGQPRWKKFYQVQSVEEVGTNLVVQLDRGLEADPGASSPFVLSPGPGNSSLIWVDYLFDWFDRGIGP